MEKLRRVGAELDGVSTAKGGTCGQRAGDGRDRERGEGGLAAAELGVPGDRVVLDHALAPQQREDAGAHDLEDVAVAPPQPACPRAVRATTGASLPSGAANGALAGGGRHPPALSDAQRLVSVVALTTQDSTTSSRSVSLAARLANPSLRLSALAAVTQRPRGGMVRWRRSRRVPALLTTAQRRAPRRSARAPAASSPASGCFATMRTRRGCSALRSDRADPPTRTKRFGEVRLEPGGDLHDQHVAFIAWARAYDDGGLGVRSRRLHDDWLERLPPSCRVLGVDGTQPVAELLDLVTGK